VQGFTAAGYDGVREAFTANFVERGDLGASCAVHDGERFVVDLWGGYVDEVRNPWRSDTLCLTYSVTKGLVTVLIARLADEGLVELDELIQMYWPEFGVQGKAATTVRMLLAHQAGLPTIGPGLDLQTLLRPGVAAERLAQQMPIWVPGESFGYHALTWGWLVDELLFRVTGERVSSLIRHKIAEPLGVELYIGLPDDAVSRVADLSSNTVLVSQSERPSESLAAQLGDSQLFDEAITAGGLLPVMDPSTWNSDAVRKASLPASNAITNARAVARIYGSLTLDGPGTFISRKTLDDFCVPQSAGVDRITGFTSRFAAGFMLPTAGNPMYSDSSFGHEGVGGAQGFADLGAGFGFGFVPNRLHQIAGGDARVAALVDAIRRARG
jgi:CubicO group peptidase (beta-lactamase class C family)